MENFDAKAAFEAEFGSLDSEKDISVKDDLLTFILARTGEIVIEAMTLDKKQEIIKSKITESEKKGEEPAKALTSEFVDNAHKLSRFTGELDAYRKISEMLMKK